MSLYESDYEPTASILAEETELLADFQPPADSEFSPVLAAEVITSAETLGYVYTRQDGTIEHAANRDEAIKLCPVLGKMAMKDPDTAALLLDMASIGQAELTEKTEPNEAEATSGQLRSEVDDNPKTLTASPRSVEQNRAIGRQAGELPARAIEPNTAAIVEVAESIRAEELQKNLGSITVSGESATQLPKLKDAAPVRSQNANRSKPVASARALPRQKTPSSAKRTRRTTEQSAPKITKVHSTKTNKRRTNHNRVKPINKETRPIVIKAKEIMPASVGSYKRATDRSVRQNYETDNREKALSAPAAIITPLVSPPQRVEVAPEISEQTRQERVPERESSEFYTEFTKALHALTFSMETALIDDATEAGEYDELRSSDAPQETDHRPEIASVIIERLDKLDSDQKAPVALILQDAAEAARSLSVLKAAENQPEAIEAATEQLKERVTILFEQLGIDYEPEDIKTFIRLLVLVDIQPSPPESLAKVTEADLEHEGTREAKRQLALLAGGLSGAQQVAEQLLGKLALLYAAGYAYIKIADIVET